MVGLTQAKPFQKQKRRGRKKPFQSKSIQVNTKLVLWIVWLSIFFVVFVYGSSLVLKRTILAPKYVISKVIYAEESVKQYDNPYLYKAISEQIKWKNYNLIRFFKKNAMRRAIKRKYPIIADIKLEYKWPHEAWVLVVFNQPQLIIKFKKRRFALYGDKTFELFSGSSLWKDGVQSLRLPQYLWDFDSLDGLFFDTNTENIVEQTNKLQDNFTGLQKIVYLPWSQRMIILMPQGKRVYINNIRPLDQQIADYKKLAKYYEGFDKLYQIDLWSLEQDRIIVK